MRRLFILKGVSILKNILNKTTSGVKEIRIFTLTVEAFVEAGQKPDHCLKRYRRAKLRVFRIHGWLIFDSRRKKSVP